MKKLIALCSFFAISFATLAQQHDTSACQPVKGDRTISFNLAGIAVMALNLAKDPLTAAKMMDLRYFYKDDIAFRIGLGVRTINTTITTKGDSTITHVLVETTNMNKFAGFSIGLGAEKHFKTRSKTIDPFLGPSIYISKLGKNTLKTTNKTTLANGDFTNQTISTITDGSFAIAVLVNAGFFWYFAQNIAIGGEFAIGYGGGNSGGDVNKTTTTEKSTAGVITTVEMKNNTINKTHLSSFQTLNTGAINLLIKF